MWKWLTVVGCFVVTAFVVHTALRIEHINDKSGSFLPRPPGREGEAWNVPDWEGVMDFVDHQIAERRVNTFMAEHPDQEPPNPREVIGAPYNESENTLIERMKVLHANHLELHWWVTKFGSWQWMLAPMAFVWSIGNFLALSKATVRVVSTSCALLAFGAIFLMIFRGY